MTNTVTIVLVILVVATYGPLVLTKRRDTRVLWAGAFLLTSGLLRLSIDVVDVRDFSAYFSSFLSVKAGSVPTELLFEPYRLVVFEGILLLGDFGSVTQITAIYYLHFAVITVFFLWLAYQEEITFELKLVLFLAFYPTIAFVWLRAGVGYAACSFMMFAFTKDRSRRLHFALPLVHASTLPIVLATRIKDLKVVQKSLVILAASAIGYLILDANTGYVQYLTYKVERYSETSDRRTSVNLLLFNVANICFFLYLCAVNPAFRQNFTVRVMMGASIFVYFINPVMGLRMFPFVLIAGIVERIAFPARYRLLTLMVCAGYLPIYYARFGQIFN